MEFYNYTGRRNMVADKSAVVVEKYRKMYQENIQMYNYTSHGKKTMIMDLVNQMDKELAQLKNGFMVQAKAGVYDNKNKLLEERASKAPKTGVEKTNDLLAFFKQVAVYEAHISMYGVDMELLQQLAQDENVSADLFNIVKAKMVAVEQDDTNRANIRGIKKVDHKMDVVNNDIMDFEVLASQVNEPILPVAMYGKDSMEITTGEPMADFYFNNNNVEVNE